MDNLKVRHLVDMRVDSSVDWKEMKRDVSKAGLMVAEKVAR